MNKKIIAVIATTLLAGGLTFVGAQSASAQTITAYCQANEYTREWQSNSVPDTILWCQMQEGPASDFGYVGPINGVMGPNSRAGIQRYLASFWGYTGPANGIYGVNTYKAMQRAGNFAANLNDQVTVNGTMNLQSWKNFAEEVEVQYFGD